jgi:glutaredoxin
MLELYTTTSCPHCKVLKKYMIEHDIAYIEKNTEEDDFALAEILAEGISSVPVIKIKDKFTLIHDVIEFKEVYERDFAK